MWDNMRHTRRLEKVKKQTDFIGRERELETLLGLWGKRVSSLVTCRGRRRIGKSRLIAEFALRSGARFIHLEGVKPQPGFSNETELREFARQLSVQFSTTVKTPENWLEAFVSLDRFLRGRGKVVVLLDEVSWFGHYDKMFASDIKIAWDNYWKKHDRTIVVICGSVSSWIKENIIDNGAFYGRRSLDVVLRELPLDQCAQFWGRRAKRIDPREIVDVLSVTGGVPRYLEEVNPALSAAENIKRLCFTPNGLLRVDFDEMFNDVITNQPTFTGKVLRCLVDGPQSTLAIARKLNVEKGGRVSSAVDRLVEAGIVSPDSGKNPETGAAVKERRFRLKDNYARFYLKYIEPVKATIDDGRYEFLSLETLEGWDVVMGLQFENLVVNNYGALIPHLHLNNVLLTSAAPYRKAAVPSLRQRGCQIDLLIQSRRTSYIVEIKRMAEIGRSIIEEVDAKVRCLKTRPNVSIRTALVYDGHLAPIVEADGYFDAIVPFKDLLGLN